MKSGIRDNIEGQVFTEEQFQAAARVWAATVRKLARVNAASFKKGKKAPITYKTGPKAGKYEPILRESIQYFVKKNTHNAVDSVSFKFPLHGVFRAWGVGKGQPRASGKRVSNHIKIRRSMDDWLDIPIDNNREKLYDVAAQYYGDQVVVRGFGSIKKNI